MMGACSRARFAVALGALFIVPCAFALNPALDISQYSHKAWKISEGFTRGTIRAMAQTPDGYLWLGTDFGLVRFDGVRNVEWTPPDGQQLPNTTIRRLLVTRDGTLWIGTFNGLASWKAGRLTTYTELAGLIVNSLLEDHEGTLWAGGDGSPPGGTLCAVRSGAAQCHQESLSASVGTLYEFHGDLWAGARAGLWRWKHDPQKLYRMPGRASSIQDLIEGDNGTLWIARAGGMLQLKDGKIEPYPLAVSGQFNPIRLLRDRDGGLWIGTEGQGLLHMHRGRADLFTSADGLSSDNVQRIFEDREGNIWAATGDGLDRFRDFVVPTISVKQGLNTVWSVVAARDGSVWMGGNDGLNRWDHGQVTIYRKRSVGPLAGLLPRPGVRRMYDDRLPENSVQSLFQDGHGRIWVSTRGGLAYLEDDRFFPIGPLPGLAVYAIAEDGAGNLWLGDQLRGLLHVREGKLVEEIPWKRLGHQNYVDAMVFDRAQSGLWLGFVQGDGLAYFRNGQIRASYSTANGLGEGRVYDLRLDNDGGLWAATDGGLSRLKNGRIATLSRKNGLPCDAVHATLEDDDHSVWLRLACGMMRIARSELDAWAADPKRTIQGRVFDSSDGLRDRALVPTFKPSAAKSADGKLWFVTEGGVSVVDPHHLPYNKLPPPVHIEQVIADRKTYAGAKLRLAPLVRDVEIDYTALSFVEPEKVQFRYKLEGHDREWQEAGNRRQAFYSDLPPRNYRFRVMASNNSGVWNEAGAFLNFTVDPAYYQTGWFRGLCLLAVAALTWLLYRLRLRQVAARLNLLYNERLAERTRIARDLHDTLLQSLAGVSLQLHGIAKQAAAAPEKTVALIDRVREQVDSSFREVRLKVWNLRSPELEGQGLAATLREFTERIGAGKTARYHFAVSGHPCPCSPEVEEELLRIAQEAANNAMRHAQASEIRIALEYSGKSLTLSVTDDGCGFDLEEGYRKTGHWGLKNMQERAAQIRGRCTITTAVGQGARIEIRVPLSSRSLRNIRAKHADSSSGGR